MTMHGGKDETTQAVLGERVRLLQHRQRAFVSQFAQTNLAAHESIGEVTEVV